jgi:hypothetical protein
MREASRVKAVIKKLERELPREVERLRYEIDVDSGGDPAIWIWVVLPDGPSGDLFDWEETIPIWSWENRSRIRERIYSLFQESELEQLVYVYFLASSEAAQQAIDDPGASVYEFAR